MIDHVVIPVSNLIASRDFYQKIFEPLGFTLSFGEDGQFYAFDLKGKGLFEIYEEKLPFTTIHVAFRAETKEQVHQFYSLALECGAKDNGPPGPRPNYTPHYYACFVLDLDGHNIEAVNDFWV